MGPVSQVGKTSEELVGMRGRVRNFGLLSQRCFKNIQGETRGSWVNKCGVEGREVGGRDTSERH